MHPERESIMEKREITSNRRQKPKVTNYNEMSNGRIQPQALDLEEAVLGALMLEKNALNEVSQILKKEHFYSDQHQIIYEAVISLSSNSKPVDILTVTQELRQMGNLDFVGGPFAITKLSNRVSSAANIEFHARIIIEKYIQREMIRIGSEMATKAFDETADVLKMLDEAQQSVFDLAEKNIKKNAESIKDILVKAINNIENARDHEDKLSGVPSGLFELDKLTSGWQKSDLIILAARPAMGKTALTLTMARNAAVAHKKKVAFFSLEMSAVQLALRLISAEAEINQDSLRSGKLNAQEWENLATKIDALSDAGLFIDDTPALGVFELRAKCRRLKAQHGIDMVYVDYLQLMRGDDNKNGNREQEISYISRSLKSMAKELDIPVIALSQLSRQVESRQNKKPILSDLRESGSIEQDADLVVFIYRPEYYKLTEFEDGSSTEGKAVILVEKNRHGKTADIRVNFIGQYGRFEDVDMQTGYTFNDDINVPDNIMVKPSRMNEDFDDMDEHDKNSEPF